MTHEPRERLLATCFIPAYSPDFNGLFQTLKAFLHQRAQRTFADPPHKP